MLWDMQEIREIIEMVWFMHPVMSKNFKACPRSVKSLNCFYGGHSARGGSHGEAACSAISNHPQWKNTSFRS